MRKLLALCVLVGAFSFMALAEDFSGHLLDAACYQQSKTAKGCDATSQTSQFALNSSGKVYMLDNAGNAKAADAMKSHAERSANPNQPSAAAGPVNAKVSATADGDTLKVTSIQIQ
jgi:hypothetical protein